MATFAAALVAALLIGGTFAATSARAAGALAMALGVAQLIRAKRPFFSDPRPVPSRGSASLGCSFPIFLSIAIYSASLDMAAIPYAVSYVVSAFASASVAAPGG